MTLICDRAVGSRPARVMVTLKEDRWLCLEIADERLVIPLPDWQGFVRFVITCMGTFRARLTDHHDLDEGPRPLPGELPLSVVGEIRGFMGTNEKGQLALVFEHGCLVRREGQSPVYQVVGGSRSNGLAIAPYELDDFMALIRLIEPGLEKAGYLSRDPTGSITSLH